MEKSLEIDQLNSGESIDDILSKESQEVSFLLRLKILFGIITRIYHCSVCAFSFLKLHVNHLDVELKLGDVRN